MFRQMIRFTRASSCNVRQFKTVFPNHYSWPKRRDYSSASNQSQNHQSSSSNHHHQNKTHDGKSGYINWAMLFQWLQETFSTINRENLSASDYRKIRLLIILTLGGCGGGGMVLGYGLRDVIDPWVQPYLKRFHQRIGSVPINEDHVFLRFDSTHFHIDRAAKKYVRDVMMRHTSGIHCICILGDSGSGKTELALACARLWYEDLGDRSPQTLRTIVYLRNDSLQEDYRRIAVQLGIECVNDDENSLILNVNKQLALRKNWLMVFDDVTDLEEIKKYIPNQQSHHHGHILITSKCLDFVNIHELNTHSINLNEAKYRLTLNEGIRLFDMMLGQRIKSEVQLDEIKGILVRHLNYQPFPIINAAHYFQSNKPADLEKAIIDFIQDFTEQVKKNKLLIESDKSTEGVENTFALPHKNGDHDESLSTIQTNDELNLVTQQYLLSQLNEQQINILLFAVCLHPDNIHSWLIKHKFNLTDIEFAKAIQAIRDRRLMVLRSDGIYQMQHSLREALLNWKLLQCHTPLTRLELLNTESGLLKSAFCSLNSVSSPDNRFSLDRDQKETCVEHQLFLLRRVKYLDESIDKMNLFDQSTLVEVLKTADIVANYYTSIYSNFEQANQILLDAKKRIQNQYPDYFSGEQLNLMKLEDSINQNEDNCKYNKNELVQVFRQLLRINYSLGRIYFYSKDSSFLSQKKAEQYFREAKTLGDSLNILSKESDLTTLLNDINGVFYLLLESNDPKTLQSAITKYQAVIFSNTEYTDFSKGIKFVVNKSNVTIEKDGATYTRMLCHWQIAKAYVKISHLLGNTITYPIKRLGNNMLSWFFKNEFQLTKQDCYHSSLDYLFGDATKMIEGAIPICLSAQYQRWDSKNKQYEIQVGYRDKRIILLNVLAGVLLLNPDDCLSHDRIGLLSKFFSGTSIKDCHSNFVLSKQIYLNVINQYEQVGQRNDYSLADAYLGLGKIYMAENEYTLAKEKLETCLAIQRDLRRMTYHKDMLEATLLLKQLNQYEKISNNLIDNQLS